MMKNLILLTLFLLGFTTSVYAQPANDECTGALVIPELSNWCSDTRAYSNQGATPTNFTDTNCFSGNHQDVWFTFIAGATEVTINIFGNTRTAPGGSLRNPEVELLRGDCDGTFNIIRCEADEDGNNAVQLRRGALVVGETYYIRVQGANGNTGDFQLCINNYNPPAEAGSDEQTAGVLCDKSSFTFEKLSGGGIDPDEADNTCLDQDKFGRDLGNSESSSTWFTWTAETSGPLTFVLTPIQETDDIDFALYELPNGINDFTGKILLRCMATACPGPTGLDMMSTDLSEDINCDGGEDGFLQFLDMEAGKSYALLINNFSDSGNGITIEFGQEPGSGTFLGPTADFISDEPDNQVCVGEDIGFEDRSSFPNGNIREWAWSFGVDATPSVGFGPGPHSVVYSSSGIKSVVLSIETDLGCILTKISNFTVLNEAEVEQLLVAPDCGGGSNGSVELNVTGGATPYEFSWNGSPFTQGDNARLSVSEGDFFISVRDGEGCVQSDTILLREPGPALNANIEPVVPPSCTGFDDGQIIISASEGTPPYQYDFGGGLVSDSIFSNVSAGSYPIYVRDAEGCDSDFLIAVEDPPVLQLDIDPMDISCNGLEDGSALAFASGGHGEYTYQWSTGAVGKSVQGLLSGNYSVTVSDKFGCAVEFPFSIAEPAPILINAVDAEDAICFGSPDGTIEVSAAGGVPPYQYSVNGGEFQDDPTFNNLFAGNYRVTVRDAENCTTIFENIIINEPPALTVDAGEDQTVNLGETTTLSASSPFDPVNYFWMGPDTIARPEGPVIEVLPRRTGNYVVSITDQTGCTALDSLRISVLINRRVYIPTAFSPNGDASNQTFTIYGGPAVTQIRSLQIYSRWGELIYEAQNFTPGNEAVGWDGTFNGEPLNTGVYAFSTQVEFLDGVVETYGGSLTLLR